MVALTGIEWVKCQFTSVRLSLSRSFSVLPGRVWTPEYPHKSVWCDPRVTAAGLAFCQLGDPMRSRVEYEGLESAPDFRLAPRPSNVDRKAFGEQLCFKQDLCGWAISHPRRRALREVGRAC